MQKCFVLGLDGMPFSLLKHKLAKGEMPNLKSICEIGGLKEMKSVYPTISSVAWTSYATGKNPAEHNIFGFVDRKANPFTIYIPTSQNRKADTIWAKLSDQGKKVIVINVPVTYPPEKVNGILISCFLCTDIRKATYPKELSNYIEKKGYIIDADAWLARQDKHKFMEELQLAMRKRFEVCFELLENDWDYFQLHVMETDRLFHFMWEDLEIDSSYSSEIERFFEDLDYYIGELYQRLQADTGVVILSDHGFCKIKYEVQINKWLEQEELLKFEGGKDKQLVNYSRESICYSLLPGRIFINLEGREEKGSVKQSDYEKVRNLIKDKLLAMKDIENNPIISKVFFREEIYHGSYMGQAADIIAHPVDGYDLKGQLDGDKIFTRTHLTGMHTYDDAILAGIGVDFSKVHSITEVADIILREMNK